MSARTLIAAVALGLGFIATCVAPLGATQVLPLDVAALAADSGLVVEGRVVASRSFWNEARTRILTEVDVAVERAHKGRGPAQVTVVQMGGVVDGMRMTVHGALHWQTDEEVLLFLEPSLPGRHRVAGFSQGKFEIHVDERTGERWAVRPALGAVELVGAPSGQGAGELRMPLHRVLEQAGLAVEEGR